jgi:hypothetical protein
MRKKNNEYEEEREHAIFALSVFTKRFHDTLAGWSDSAQFVDEESAVCLQAYAQAETALLNLLKEESEE